MPLFLPQFENGIARIGRARFHHMTKRHNVAIGWRSDAAGIDDHASVAKPHRPRNMRMPAKDQRLRNADGSPFDIRDGCKAPSDRSGYRGGVPFSARTCPARYNEPVIRMRGGTS